MELARFFAVPGEDSAGGVEDLAESVEPVEAVVEAIENAGAAGAGDVDGVDDELAVGRDLRHEAEALLAAFFRECAPADEIVVADGADFFERD